MADYQMLTGGSLLGAGNLLRSGNLLGGGSLLMGGAVVPLIRAGWLSPLVTFSRASGASVLGADGATWSEVAANVPRFSGSARRLLMEGARTNIVRNPRAEGASAPSTPPTNLTMTNTAGTVTVTPGVGYADFNIAFTATGSVEIRPEPTAQSAGQILAGEQWSLGSIVSLASGTLGGITSVRHMLEFRNSSGVQLSGVQSVFVPTATPAAYFTTGLAPTNTDRASMILRVDGTNGAALTLRVRYPQVERGAFASTPVLPPVGSPATSTRAADLLSVPLSSLGIGANGACTILWSGMIPQISALTQHLLSLDDGTSNNRFRLFQAAGVADVNIGRTIAGSGSSNTIGSPAAGTLFSAGVSIDGAGRIAGSLNGAAVVAQLGGPTTGLTMLRQGANASGAENLFGETARFTVLPYPVSDSTLAAMVASFPLS